MLVICCVWKRGILDQLWDDEMFPTCSGTKTVISYHIPCSIPIMVTFISQLSLLWLVISIVSPSFHITIISITSYTSYNIYNIYTHNYTYHNTFPSIASSLSLHPETSNPFKSSSSMCVKTLYPFCSHQNSWFSWMFIQFIPLKMVLIAIDPYPVLPSFVPHFPVAPWAADGALTTEPCCCWGPRTTAAWRRPRAACRPWAQGITR